MRTWPASRVIDLPRGGSRMTLDWAESARARGVAVYFEIPGHVRLEFGGEQETVAEVGRRLARAAVDLMVAPVAARR